MAAIEANLLTIAGGGTKVLFDRAIQMVIENIKDPNTDAKKKRKIVLTFDCEPYADRSGFHVEAAVETKLQAPQGVSGTVYIGRDGQRLRGYTQDIKQGDLFAADKTEDEDPATGADPTIALPPN
jgi:hypothetical protein